MSELFCGPHCLVWYVSWFAVLLGCEFDSSPYLSSTCALDTDFGHYKWVIYDETHHNNPRLHTLIHNRTRGRQHPSYGSDGYYGSGAFYFIDPEQPASATFGKSRYAFQFMAQSDDLEPYATPKPDHVAFGAETTQLPEQLSLQQSTFTFASMYGYGYA